MPNIRDIQRGPYWFAVDDTPITASWNFWNLWARGTWEGPALDKIAALIKPGDVFYDIGAWVGPISLWAGALGARVVALEPDPVAYQILRLNIALNPTLDIREVEAALTDGQSVTAELYFNEGESGNSASSMTRETNRSALVRTISIDEMLIRWPNPMLAKMDIEGGESIVLPTVGPRLRELGVPLILATHPQWYAPGGEQAMAQELAHWHTEPLEGNDLFCTP